MKNRKVDLNQFKKITEKDRFLKPAIPTPRVEEGDKKNEVVGKEKAKKSERGRPMISKEPLNKPVSFLVTETELNQIDGKAGMVSRGVFLREILKKAGVIA